MLSKEIEEKTHELRKIRGEVLPGMDIEELQKLEKELEVGLSHGERFLEEITALQQKISALELKFIWFQCITVSYFSDDPLHNDIMMENLFSTQTHVLEQGQSSESITNICSSSYPQDNDSSNISQVGISKQIKLWLVGVDGSAVGNKRHQNPNWDCLPLELPLMGLSCSGDDGNLQREEESKGSDKLLSGKMTRRRIQIKKIDNTTARLVAFSKRRKGLFKKAFELSTLCDAEIGLMVFSATGKLFEYASSSVQQVIERHDLHPENLGKMDQLFLELPLENGTSYAMLSKEIEEKTHELRKIRGEELPGMDIEELQKLEKVLEGERFLEEITALQQKGAQLMEENQRLKQMENLFSTQTHVLEQGQSSEATTNICSSSDPQDNDSSNISLKLGLDCSIS
uniref:MADS-box domain-containing protein n=1 Tax=Quercus lobata TaxID=97700 RepID=A0A7N2MVS8_QUELO